MPNNGDSGHAMLESPVYQGVLHNWPKFLTTEKWTLMHQSGAIVEFLHEYVSFFGKNNT